MEKVFSILKKLSECGKLMQHSSYTRKDLEAIQGMLAILTKATDVTLEKIDKEG